MAAYSNYQMPQFAQPPPPASAYGQPQYQQQQAQQQPLYSPPAGVGQAIPNQFNPYASDRQAPRRSLSMGTGKSIQAEMSLAVFDPYASTTTAPVAPAEPAYNHFALPPVQQQQQHSPYFASTTGPPPSLFNEEMTTSPPSHFGFAVPPNQQQPQYQQSMSASVVSDISMFTGFPPPSSTYPAAAAGQTAMVPATNDDSDLSDVDPALIAEQERIWQDIQDRRKMELIRADGGIPPQRAIIPFNRSAPPRTRSMPNPYAVPGDRGQRNSVALGGVAVLDPKKDKRKQTRKLKTATGAVGGAVVGGLILGPVGVVLGAGGGAAVSNKMAKARDKRKQQQFEQLNFQKGAAQSQAAKGDGSFV